MEQEKKRKFFSGARGKVKSRQGQGGRVRRKKRSKMGQNLSAPSPGDDLRQSLRFVYAVKLYAAILFWEIGCDFSAVAIRLRLRCILR